MQSFKTHFGKASREESQLLFDSFCLTKMSSSRRSFFLLAGNLITVSLRRVPPRLPYKMSEFVKLVLFINCFRVTGSALYTLLYLQNK